MITVICSRCAGSGQVEYYDNYGQGGFYPEVCPECNGAGRVQELSFEERKKLKQEMEGGIG